MGINVGNAILSRGKLGRTATSSVKTLAAASLSAGALVLAACVPPTASEVPAIPLNLVEHTVDASIPGVSFAKAADVIGDASPELVVSAFGTPTTAPGTVTLYSPDGDLDSWNQTPVVTLADDIKFPNDTEMADLNGDGLADLIVSGGFFSCSFSGTGCGSLQWFEQKLDGSFERHNIVTPNNSRFYHRSIISDVNGDGIDDLVTVGETFDTARTEWYEGTSAPGAGRFLPTPHIIGSGGGSLPVMEDVDGDGDLDVVSPQYFSPGSGIVWFERTANPTAAQPAGAWTKHQLAKASFGKGFEIELVSNLFGDGIDRWIATNHQNENFESGIRSALWLLEPGADITEKWNSTELSSGILARPKSPTTLAPGLFGTGDLDGDGSLDVVMSGDGDDGLFALLGDGVGGLTTYRITSDMGQAGGAEIVDIDGDGAMEALFTSYEQGVVKLYEVGP